MFVFVVVTLLAVSSALAERSLSLSLSGEMLFGNTNGAIVTTTLVNTGDEELILLNNPSSVLSDMPTNKFIISNEQGHSPPFVGMFVSYVPEEATSFTTIPPGKSVSVEHNIARAYDFTRSGSGVYSVKPASPALLLLTGNGVEEIFADATSAAHIAQVSSGTDDQFSFSVLDFDYGHDRLDSNADEGEDAIEADNSNLARPPRRPRFYGCSGAQQNVIRAAIPTAQAYARDASIFLGHHGAPSARYREWFGTFDLQRRNRLLTNFYKIEKHNFGTSSYNCSCTRQDWRAYVYRNQYGMTWLCPAYWRTPGSGPGNKAGTLVHEASHWEATAGTFDVAYGQGGARSLARRDPAKAATNADSYRFFAENIPAL